MPTPEPGVPPAADDETQPRTTDSPHDFDDDYRLKLYETFRDRIKQEDMLINQRVNYLLTSQAFLLGPFIVSYTSDVNHINPAALKDPVVVQSLMAQQNTLRYLQEIVPGLGLASCLITLFAVGAALWAIERTRNNYRALEGKTPEALGLLIRGTVHLSRWSGKTAGIVPDLISSRLLHVVGQGPSVLLVLLVGAVWSSFIWRGAVYRVFITNLTHWIPVLLAILGVVVCLWGAFHLGRLRERTKPDVATSRNGSPGPGGDH